MHRPVAFGGGRARGGCPRGDAAGAPRQLAHTRACVRAWGAGADLLEQLAVLYAIEAGQPEISATKLGGAERPLRLR